MQRVQFTRWYCLTLSSLSSRLRPVSSSELLLAEAPLPFECAPLPFADAPLPFACVQLQLNVHTLTIIQANTTM